MMTSRGKPQARAVRDLNGKKTTTETIPAVASSPLSNGTAVVLVGGRLNEQEAIVISCHRPQSSAIPSSTSSASESMQSTSLRHSQELSSLELLDNAIERSTCPSSSTASASISASASATASLEFSTEAVATTTLPSSPPSMFRRSYNSQQNVTVNNSQSSFGRISTEHQPTRTSWGGIHQPRGTASSYSRNVASDIKELNRLKFSSMGLYGRDAELETLHRIYEQLGKTETQRQKDDQGNKGNDKVMKNLVLVGGPSGTGKTSLLKQFMVQRQKRDGIGRVLSVCGKFDQPSIHKNNNSNTSQVASRSSAAVAASRTPYVAFVTAFTQLCSDVRNHVMYQSTIRDAIIKAVGKDYGVLLDLIPNLGELIYSAGAMGNDGDDEGGKVDKNIIEEDFDIIKSQKRFNFLLHEFLGAVCRPEHKVILALDDVQWSDSASLDLLEQILTDPRYEQSLLIICSYRDNEIDHDRHPFLQRIHRVQDKRQQTPTSISIQNLSLSTVNCFISDLLNLSTSRTEKLAVIAHKKVNGNMFFLIQFLVALRDKGLLKYNIGMTEWMWDEVEVRKSTVVAENVLTVLMDKLRKLPDEAKRLLQIAACLGPSFDGKVMSIIDRHLLGTSLFDGDMNADGDNCRKNSTDDILDFLTDEGLLEIYTDHGRDAVYCFTHDQIELASHSLFDEDNLPRLKFQIGMILYEHRIEFDFAGLLFTVVDLCNDGYHRERQGPDDRLLIDLNRQAGKKALESFAFESSTIYLRKAIGLIPNEQRWKDYYDASLELYNALIKAEYSIGNWSKMQSDIEIILSQPALGILDKMTAYCTMLTTLTVQKHEHKASIGLAIDILDQLGTTFRPQLGMLAVVVALIKTKSLVSKIPLESLLQQNEMDDKYKRASLEIIGAINSSLYAANPALMTCMVLKTLRWSLKYGISKHTPQCIGVYGLLEMALGKYESGMNAISLALELTKKQKLENTEYAPYPAAYGFVLPWTMPLHHCRNQLLAGYNICVACGDLEHGYMAIVLYCFFCYSTGKPFSNLEADMRDYAGSMKEQNQVLQLQFLCLTWQTILNLMGRCQDNLILTGEVMDQEKMLQAADRDKNPPLRAQVQCHRLQLAVYYRDFDLAATLIRLSSNIGTVNPCNPIIWRTALFEGIAAFELVRQRKHSRKYKKVALRALARVKKWVEAGNINCVHILYLLRAEKAAILDQNTAEAKVLFEKAIVTAARNGFRNDHALASERCGDWYATLGDEFWTNDFYHKAYDVYEEMEAFGKLEHMRINQLRHNSSNGRSLATQTVVVPAIKEAAVEDRVGGKIESI